MSQLLTGTTSLHNSTPNTELSVRYRTISEAVTCVRPYLNISDCCRWILYIQLPLPPNFEPLLSFTPFLPPWASNNLSPSPQTEARLHYHHSHYSILITPNRRPWENSALPTSHLPGSCRCRPCPGRCSDLAPSPGTICSRCVEDLSLSSSLLWPLLLPWMLCPNSHDSWQITRTSLSPLLPLSRRLPKSLVLFPHHQRSRTPAWGRKIWVPRRLSISWICHHRNSPSLLIYIEIMRFACC